MIRVWVAALLALAAVSVTPAAAEPLRTSNHSGSQPVHALPATFSGRMVVRFHGDTATGCATRGLCGYAGTVQWTPDPEFTLQTSDLVYGGYSFSLQTQGEDGVEASPDAGGVTEADVEHQLAGSAEGSCADAGLTGGELYLPLSEGRVTFTLGLAESSIVQTRCAGPLITDLASALPEASVSLHRVLEGDATIDLRGDRSFAADGFAGTVNSTLMLRLGTPYTDGRVSPPGPLPPARSVTARYDVAVRGGTVDHIRGYSMPALCEPLGACGVDGTVSLQPAVDGAGAAITATGSEHLPYRDFLAALHIRSSAGAPRRIDVSGQVLWHQGTATADLAADGVACTDSVQLGAGEVDLYPTKSGLRAYYYFGDSLSGDYFRTRCPGPFAATSQPASAKGSVRWSQVARRRFVLELRGTGTPLDDGYTQHIASKLRLTFTRVSVTES